MIIPYLYRVSSSDGALVTPKLHLRGYTLVVLHCPDKCYALEVPLAKLPYYVYAYVDIRTVNSSYIATK
jgi:hypothetical protein